MLISILCKVIPTWNKYKFANIYYIFFISGRQWTYQTCTEFGYYQSTDSEKQVYGKTFPIRYIESLQYQTSLFLVYF